MTDRMPAADSSTSAGTRDRLPPHRGHDAGPRLARRLPLRHAGHQGGGAVGLGGRQRHAPSCASTIPAMASPAASSPTARSRNGSAESLAVFRALHVRARRSWSARRWAPGSRCAWSQELRKAGEGEPRRRPGAARAGARFHHRPDRAGADRRRRSASWSDKGYFEEPSDYSPEPNIYTRALIEDGAPNRVLTGPIDTHCPGPHPAGHGRSRMCRYAHALKLVSLLPADDVTLSLIPDGDHRLSRPQDIALHRDARRGRSRACVTAQAPSLHAAHACASPSRSRPSSRPSSASAARWRSSSPPPTRSARRRRRRRARSPRSASPWRSRRLCLSWRTKMPVITAWSTPGAALVAASSGFTHRRRRRRLHRHGAAARRHRPVRAADPADLAHSGLGRLGHAGRHRRHLRHQRGQDDPGRSAG